MRFWQARALSRGKTRTEERRRACLIRAAIREGGITLVKTLQQLTEAWRPRHRPHS